MSTATALILPGLGNSGPEHWQSQFERTDPTCVRVMQDEWDAPRCADWAMRLESAISEASGPVVLVSHSSSCALVAHWAASAPPASLTRVKGALLVAPSDPDGPHYPAGPTGFSPVPMAVLPFRTIVVASDDDQYVTIERAREYAAAWGAKLVELRGAGHINVAAGFGPWADGYSLLQSLRNPV